MDVEPEVVDKPNAKPLPFVKGEIRYEGVWLEYVAGIPVLKDVNLHIRPGTTAALVGQTGAGKTSMVSLLMRFYDVTSGRLAVDGYDLATSSAAPLPLRPVWCFKSRSSSPSPWSTT